MSGFDPGIHVDEDDLTASQRLEDRLVWKQLAAILAVVIVIIVRWLWLA
jgi:hypothetical protein